MDRVIYITALLAVMAGHCTEATTITAVEPQVVRSLNNLPNLQSVILACRVDQNTTALETSWMFGGVQIDNTTSAQFAGRVSIGFSTSGTASELRTTLMINRLLYSDTGEYTCEVSSTSSPANPAFTTVTLLLQAQLDIVETPVMGSENDSEVQLGCEMRGYIRPDGDLLWLNVNLTNNRFTVEYQDGQPNIAQFGGSSLVHSRVSLLKISNPTAADSGRYQCALLGTTMLRGIDLIVQETPTTSTENTVSGPTSTTVEVNTTTENGTSATTENGTSTTTESETTEPTTAEVPIILVVSVLGGVVGVTLFLLIVVIICVIALWRKRQTLNRRETTKKAAGGGDADTKPSTANRILPAIPFESTRPTSEDFDYVNEGLGPVYYSTVREYDYIPADYNPVLIADNPSYQSTSYPTTSADALWNKDLVTTSL